MNFKTSQILFSEPRMGKYVKACGGDISTAFALSHYQLICNYIAYMGQTPLEVISWAERPDAIIEKIESMRSR